MAGMKKLSLSAVWVLGGGKSAFAAAVALLMCGGGTAWAQDVGGGESGALASFIPLILIMAVFYFLLIRPQQKRAKAHRNMLEALAVGDEVLTSGGIFGKVTKITDNAVILEVGKVEIPIQKQSIQSLLPPGSLEKL